MKVLLAGGDGYLGRGIQRFLQRNSIDFAVCDQPNDIIAISAESELFSGIDACVNLAFVHESGSQLDLEGRSWRTNVLGTSNLAKISANLKIPFVTISTREVYGYTTPPGEVASIDKAKSLTPKRGFRETDPVLPTSVYGQTKVVSEWIATSRPLGYVVRLATPYTDEAKQNEGHGLIASLIRNSRESESVKLPNWGETYRDPVHTDDIARLIMRIIEIRPDPSVFNCGFAGENIISLREIARLANPSVKIEGFKSEDFGFSFDSGKAKEVVDWEPKTRFRDWIIA